MCSVGSARTEPVVSWRLPVVCRSRIQKPRGPMLRCPSVGRRLQHQGSTRWRQVFSRVRAPRTLPAYPGRISRGIRWVISRVAVEKVQFRRKRSKFGGYKMPWNPRGSLITNPDAILFLWIWRERVFQHPRDITTANQEPRRYNRWAMTRFCLTDNDLDHCGSMLRRMRRPRWVPESWSSTLRRILAASTSGEFPAYSMTTVHFCRSSAASRRPKHWAASSSRKKATALGLELLWRTTSPIHIQLISCALETKERRSTWILTRPLQTHSPQ